MQQRLMIQLVYRLPDGRIFAPILYFLRLFGLNRVVQSLSDQHISQVVSIGTSRIRRPPRPKPIMASLRPPDQAPT